MCLYLTILLFFFFFFFLLAGVSSSKEEYQVTFVIGTQIIINPGSDIVTLYCSWKMLNPNPNHGGIQTTNLKVMIGWCLLDNFREGPNRHPSNVSCSNFKNTKTKVTFQLDDTNGKMDWRRKQNVIHCFLRVILLEDGIEKEWSKFGQNPQIIIEAQGFADQARMIWKKG